MTVPLTPGLESLLGLNVRDLNSARRLRRIKAIFAAMRAEVRL